MRNNKEGNDADFKTALTKNKGPDNAGLLKRFLKWLTRGAEQSKKSGGCRT